MALPGVAGAAGQCWQLVAAERHMQQQGWKQGWNQGQQRGQLVALAHALGLATWRWSWPWRAAPRLDLRPVHALLACLLACL